jgi:NADH pyrophosphatase NudC (nudix superfamily)
VALSALADDRLYLRGPTGDIVLDKSEMAEAGWYRAGALPPVPPPPTISRRLIDWFVLANSSG